MALGVYIRTEEARRNMALAKTGSNWSAKRREAHIAWKADHPSKRALERKNSPKRGSIEWKQKCSEGHKRFYAANPEIRFIRGKDKESREKGIRTGEKHIFKNKEVWVEKIANGMKRYNETHPEQREKNRERIRKLGESMVGEKNHKWIADRSKFTTDYLARNSIEYRLWREAVFARDNFTCVECNVQGIELNADHIKPFALFPELRFAIDNGRTLCVPCHKKTETYGGKVFSYKKTLNSYE